MIGSTTSRRRRATLSVALAMATVLAACGSSGDRAAPVVTEALPGEEPLEVTVPETTTTLPAPDTTIVRPLAGTLAVPSVTTTLAPATTVPVPLTTAPAAPATTKATVAAKALPKPAPVPPERAAEPKVLLGRIDIPKLGVSMDLWEGITLNTLDRGPGHWPGTAMPGQPGNVVVAGHRVSHSKPFRNIDKLADGDQVIFTIGGQQTVYVVTGSEIVPPTAVNIVDQTPDATATLFACHPPGSTRFRWVTHLKLQA
jgi:sortase A